MRKNWKNLFCSIAKISLLLAAAYFASAATAFSEADNFLNSDINTYIDHLLSTEHLNGEIIVKFKDEIAHDPLLIEQSSATTHIQTGGVVKRKFKRFKGLQHVRLSKPENMRKALKSYLENPDIEYAEPNYIVRISTSPDDTDFNNLWGLHNNGQTGGTVDADIDATEAWDISTGNATVIVAVIDTGVDYNHDDLASNMWINTAEIPGNGIDDDSNGKVDDDKGWDFITHDNDPYDDNGHGTHCSGTIGAVGDNGIGIAGINWNIKIMPLKAFDASGEGNTVYAISAIEYAVDNGANIISNSWGGSGKSVALQNAIEYANDNDVLFIAAAGNYGMNNDDTPYYPASFDLPNILSVAATNHNDNLAGFSNFGIESVDLAAPGVSIYSTFPPGAYINSSCNDNDGDGYGYCSGTSMATPHASGVAALILGEDSTLSRLEIRDLILNTVDVKSSLAGKVLTGGRLNAYNALDESFCSVDIAINTDTCTDHLTLQAAYDNAYSGDTIKSRAVTLAEDLLFNQSKSIFIDGGYDCSYTHNADGTTIFNGTITINEGVVTIGNVVLE